jgi:hypothetical protein
MLRAKVGFKVIGSIRPVTEGKEEPGLCAATLVRWVQQVRRQLLGSYRSTGSIRNRHGFAAVYRPTVPRNDYRCERAKRPDRIEIVSVADLRRAAKTQFRGHEGKTDSSVAVLAFGGSVNELKRDD